VFSVRFRSAASLAVALSLASVVALPPTVAFAQAGTLPSPASPVAKTNMPSCGPAAAGAARCHARVRTDLLARNATPLAGKGAPVASAGVLGNNGAYDPSYLQSAYQTPSATAGTGQTVAIVDAYDDPNAEADLNSYRSYFGLPGCTSASGCFHKVNQNGQASPLPSSNASWSQEIALDLDMVSAICPNCKILLVEANSATFSDLGTAANSAVSLGATVVSNSYGGSEFSSETNYDSYYKHPGVAVTVSSGDSGYGVEYPAASQFVTAVGGTSLSQLTNTGTRNASETVWSGAGSGCSAYETKPSWQRDAGCTKRTVADASAVADPNTGVWVYDSFTYQGQSGWLIFGGTSVASPIVGSLYALAQSNGGSSYPSSYPYADPAGLNDITSGSNGSCGTYLCNGSSGYDGPSGLGTPNGTGAFKAAASIADFSIAVTPSSVTAAPGSSASYTVTVSASNGYSSPVNLSASGVPSGATATFSPNPAAPPSSSTLAVSLGSSTPSGTYSLKITGVGTDSASITHSTTVTLVVASPNFSLSVSPSSQTVKGAGTTSYTVTLAATNGYSSAVTLSATGLPTGGVASFSANPVTPSASGTSSVLTVTTSATTPAGTYALTVTGTGTDSTTHSSTVTLVVKGDYVLVASSSALSVTKASSTTDSIVLTTADAYSSPVTLSASGLPRFASASFSPNPLTPTASGATSTLTVTAGRKTPTGVYQVTIAGKGSDGVTHTTTVSLTVQ